MGEAWIIDGVRSPRGRGKANGSLHHIHPQELLAQVLNALRDRVGFDPDDVDDVVVGNGNSSGDQGMCIGRMAVLAAGWPVEAPGITLNRFCGSGQQAVTFAAMGIQAGHQDLVVGAGVEMMSRWPVEEGAVDFSAGNPALRERFPLVPQGVSADLIATVERFDRDVVDAFALSSQQRAATAIDEGRFDRSVVPIHNEDGSVALDRDEFPRPGTTLDGAGQADPVVRGDGTRRRPRLRALVRRDVPAGVPGGRGGRARAPRRQLVGCGRRGQRVGAGVARLRQGARVHAPGADRDERRRRRRAGDHAHGTRSGVAEVPPTGGHDGRRHRPVGDQRGVRRRPAEDDA